MSSTIEILKNANRLVLDQLDAADERIKAKETEARLTLDNCVSRREALKRKRQLIQDIERMQLESIAELDDVETLVGDLPDRPHHESTTPTRIADRLAFAVVKASQTGVQLKR
jgi:hypothetical protein